MFKETLTQKPSMEVGTASHLSLQVAGEKGGGSMRYTLENDGPDPTDPKSHRTLESFRELFPNYTWS